MEDPPVEWPPELLPGADELVSAFWALCADRQTGMSPGAIPFASIDRWAARNGFDDPEEFAALAQAVRSMDDEWLRAARGGGSAPSTRPLSLELFDALWG